MDFPLKVDGQKLFGEDVRKLRRDVLSMAGEYIVATNSGNALTIQIDSNESGGLTAENISTVFAGHKFRIKSPVTISGAATLTVKNNAASAILTNISIKKNGSYPLVDKDILSGEIFEVVYDGSNMQLITNIHAGGGVTSGEALTAINAVYIKSSDGKFWKTTAAAVGEAVEKFSGFADSSVSSNTAFKVMSGPTVKGFTGLSAGSIYYLSDTAGAISTTPGTITKPIGLAISTTELYIFNPSGNRMYTGKTDLNFPAISGTADTTVTLGFKARSIHVLGLLQINSNGGAFCALIDIMYDGTVCKGGFWIDPSSVSTQLLAYDDVLTTDPTLTPTSGSNASSLKLTINAIDETSITFRLTNTITAGSGNAGQDRTNKITIMAIG